MSMVSCRGLTASYNGTEVLHEVDLSVDDGEWVVVVGPNGSGKTSLVRALSGSLPVGGQVTIGDQLLRDMRRREVAAQVAVVPQAPVVPEGMTVSDYVLLGRTPYIPYWGTEGPVDLVRVAEVLASLDLVPFSNRPLTSLSGGERQRAVLGRALCQDASVLLLDEPTAALDLGHQQQVLELVDQLRVRHRLAVISTLHDLTFAAAYGDRLIVLVEGRVVASGEPAVVLQPKLIEKHFGAAVEVLEGPNGPVVVSVRPGTGTGSSDA